LVRAWIATGTPAGADRRIAKVNRESGSPAFAGSVTESSSTAKPGRASSLRMVPRARSVAQVPVRSEFTAPDSWTSIHSSYSYLASARMATKIVSCTLPAAKVRVPAPPT
jgi:hypothetical protein